MAPCCPLTDFVLGYKPTIWGNFQWAANPGVTDSTTTAREDPGYLDISSVGRPRSYRPRMRFCRGLRGVHTVDNLVLRKLRVLVASEPVVEHLISAT